MPDARMPGSLTRRRFLIGLSCLAGSLAIAPSSLVLATNKRAHPGTRMPFNVGVLLPRSNIYPALGENLLAGLALGFEPAAAETAGVTFRSADVGFGSSQAVEQAHRMVEGGFDLVVGLVSSGVVGALRDVFRGGRVPLLAVNIGANVLRADEQDPNVFHHSLGLWRANWALGRWAAGRIGVRGLVVSSFYDSGYDSLHAFRLGFESAGGEVVDLRVTHVPPGREDFAGVLRAVRDLHPDFVYASYCGPDAVDFVSAYAEAGLARRVPLIGSAFLTDEANLPAQGQAALGIRSCFSWASNLDNVTNRRFVADYQARMGRTPDAVAALGFDTGCLVRAALTASELGASGLRGALARAEWDGPCGRARMDPETQTSAAPLYLREVQERGGKLANVVLAQGGAGIWAGLDRPQTLEEHFQAVRGSLKTGWLNAYLSV